MTPRRRTCLAHLLALLTALGCCLVAYVLAWVRGLSALAALGAMAEIFF